VRAAKEHVLDALFAGDLRWLLLDLCELAAADARHRDLGETAIAAALRAVTLELSCYRTYAAAAGAAPADRERVARAAAAALAAAPGLDPEAVRFAAAQLAPAAPVAGPALRCAQRWQQLTGPLAAKGLEDTALYRDLRLPAWNEVGCRPDDPRRADGLAAFHAFGAERARLWPRASNATSTHDTKRGEDARCRLHVLAEVPAAWARVLARCRELAAPLRADGVPAPDEQLAAWQALLAAWPADGRPHDLAARLETWVVKAAREARVRTSWLAPDERREAALVRFVRALADGPGGAAARAAFAPFAARVAGLAVPLSLAQLVLKVVLPGVPDFYQGSEGWDLSLVDPDNRRPCAWHGTAATVAALHALAPSPAACAGLWRAWPDGRVKTWTMLRALAVRAAHAATFAGGAYAALDVSGPGAAEVCAFARVAGARSVWCAVPRSARFAARRRFAGLRVTLPPGPGRWRDAFTGHAWSGGAVPLAEAWHAFPVALGASE
jgi:(1->4)-alpha-D-glucan 1-alpha-D-glucosylmutase